MTYPQSGHALAVSGLTCTRNGRTVFRDISFGAAPGGAVGVSGPNGSGKTSLLRAIAGLLPCAAGTVSWHGNDVRDAGSAWRREVVYCGHRNAIKPGLTVRENVVFWIRLARSPLSPCDALECVNLRLLADVPAAALSAGQQKRLSLARLVVGTGVCWLLDEPFASLDDASVHLFQSLILTNQRNNGIVIVSAHGDMKIDCTTAISLGT